MHMLLGWLMPLLAPWPYCAQVRYRRGLRHVDGVRLEPLTNPSPPPACSHVQAELWPSNHAETLPMEAPCFLLTSVQTFKIRVCLQPETAGVRISKQLSDPCNFRTLPAEIREPSHLNGRLAVECPSVVMAWDGRGEGSYIAEFSCRGIFSPWAFSGVLSVGRRAGASRHRGPGSGVLLLVVTFLKVGSSSLLATSR